LAESRNLRQTGIARALGEHDSTVMRALPVAQDLGILLTKDDAWRLAVLDE